MAELTVYGRSQNPTPVAAEAGGDSFKNSGSPSETEINWINNGAAKTMTVTAQSRCRHRFLHDEVIPIPAGSAGEWGPAESSRFNDAQGMVHFSFDDVDDLEVYIQRVLT